MSTGNTGRTAAAAAGRQADTGRRRARVIKAINQAATTGEEITVAGIARAAAVDRTFLYRHRDLLQQIHAHQAQPATTVAGHGPAVSRASLQADLLAAQERAARHAARVHQLEQRLSQLLGEQAWKASGLAPPTTSTPSNTASTISNSRSPTSSCNWPNKAMTWTLPAPPTANS
jgi:hypothetical protein